MALNKKGNPIEQVYFLFKTSRMTLRTRVMAMDLKSSMVPIFSDIISLKIGDKNELIDVKLFKQNLMGEDS